MAKWKEPAIGHQRREDLVFAHWQLPVDQVARQLPPGLDVDTFDGTAWISLVAFCSRARAALLPETLAVDVVEVNVRTYVRCGDARAVWFSSVDVTSPIAQAVYRLLVGRSARRADIACVRAGDVVVYGARRGHATLSLRADGNAPTSAVLAPALASFLLDRKLFVARRFGRLWSMRVEHAPLVPEAAAVDVVGDDWLRARRWSRPGAPVLAHTAQNVDVAVFAPRPVPRARLTAPAPARLAT